MQLAPEERLAGLVPRGLVVHIAARQVVELRSVAGEVLNSAQCDNTNVRAEGRFIALSDASLIDSDTCPVTSPQRPEGDFAVTVEKGAVLARYGGHVCKVTDMPTCRVVSHSLGTAVLLCGNQLTVASLR